MVRNCLVCRAEIRECMGSVIAGDMLEYEDGFRPIHEVRELCGKCVMRLIAKEESREFGYFVPEVI